MCPMVAGAGVELAYSEQGSGPVVLLVHGVAADAATWQPVMDGLGGRARVIAYDRRGYGDSQAPLGYRRTTVQEQAQDALALLNALDAAPTLLCGADLGALICLELALRHAITPAGLVLVEPAALALVPDATEALSAQRAELDRAVRERGPEAGVEVWLAAWDGSRAGGEGAAAGELRLARARGHARAFFADYAGLASWPATRRELRSLSLPVVVVDGPSTPAHLRGAAEAVTELLPQARRRSDADVDAALDDALSCAVR